MLLHQALKRNQLLLVLPRVSETDDITSTAARSKTIDCDNCGGSTTEADSKKVPGMVVCSGCAKEFAGAGVDFTKVNEKYDSIQYDPFKPVNNRSRSVPGYAKTGMITLQLNGTAPKSLDGQKLDVTSKFETAYFPDNPIGRELVRLFGVLHQQKLIYVIDESRTLVFSGNSSLLSPNYRNRRFDLTRTVDKLDSNGRVIYDRKGKAEQENPYFYDSKGKKVVFADLKDEELQKYGIRKSFGVTFNVHFKTALSGCSWLSEA